MTFAEGWPEGGQTAMRPIGDDLVGGMNALGNGEGRPRDVPAHRHRCT
jgi:hypothetical protein